MTIFWFVPKAHFWRAAQFRCQACAKVPIRGIKANQRRKREEEEKVIQYPHLHNVYAATTT